MKYLAIILLFACGSVKRIEFTSWSVRNDNSDVLITCVGCDTVQKDSSLSFIITRLKEVNDSISLVVHQNQWLDSVGKTLDTVKWTPYYYKPKKKK